MLEQPSGEPRGNVSRADDESRAKRLRALANAELAPVKSEPTRQDARTGEEPDDDDPGSIEGLTRGDGPDRENEHKSKGRPGENQPGLLDEVQAHSPGIAIPPREQDERSAGEGE